MERFKTLLTALALSMAVLPMGAAAAVPADTVDAKTPEAIVQAELMRALTAESAQTQKRAARRVRAYAHTRRYNEAFFQDLVVPLHDIVAGGRTDEVRIVAVSALSAIGTDVAMLGLQVQQDSLGSDRLKAAVEQAFAQYAAKHIDDTERTQVLQ